MQKKSPAKVTGPGCVAHIAQGEDKPLKNHYSQGKNDSDIVTLTMGIGPPKKFFNRNSANFTGITTIKVCEMGASARRLSGVDRGAFLFLTEPNPDTVSTTRFVNRCKTRLVRRQLLLIGREHRQMGSVRR